MRPEVPRRCTSNEFDASGAGRSEDTQCAVKAGATGVAAPAFTRERARRDREGAPHRLALKSCSTVLCRRAWDGGRSHHQGSRRPPGASVRRRQSAGDQESEEVVRHVRAVEQVWNLDRSVVREWGVRNPSAQRYVMCPTVAKSPVQPEPAAASRKESGIGIPSFGEAHAVIVRIRRKRRRRKAVKLCHLRLSSDKIAVGIWSVASSARRRSIQRASTRPFLQAFKGGARLSRRSPASAPSAS